MKHRSPILEWAARLGLGLLVVFGLAGCSWGPGALPQAPVEASSADYS